MPTQEHIFEVVRGSVAARLGISLDDVSWRSRFDEDLGANSLTSVELLIDLEDRLGVTITDTEAARLTTVGHAVDYVFARLTSGR